jgi:uncharacterized protein (UPF0332 family)
MPERGTSAADYATGAVFTDEEASQIIADAEAFLTEARRRPTKAVLKATAQADHAPG